MRQIILITLFVLTLSTLGFGQKYFGQDGDKCIAAVENGTAIFYLPSDFRRHRKTRDGEFVRGLEADGCVRMLTVKGTQYVAQKEDEKFIFDKDGNVIAREDCGNPSSDLRYPKAKEEGREMTYDCPPGFTWDANRKKCVAQGVTEMICPPGFTWDANRKKCIAEGITEIICPQGYNLDAKTGKCLTVAKTLECPKGKHWSANKSKCVGGRIPWKWIGVGLAIGVGGYVLYEALDDDDSCKTGCGTKIPQKDNSIRTSSGGNSTRPRILGYTSSGEAIYETENFGSAASVVSAPTKPLAESKITAICKDWVGKQCVAY